MNPIHLAGGADQPNLSPAGLAGAPPAPFVPPTPPYLMPGTGAVYAAPGTPYAVSPNGSPGQYVIPSPVVMAGPAAVATTNGFGVAGLALRLGFVSVVIASAVVLVVVGYPVVAVIEVLIAAGVVAVEILRRLG
jgi:hypothetical protein